MEVPINQLHDHISMLRSSTQIEPINKGLSPDRKYLVTTETADKWLLRVAPIDQFERKQAEFQIIQQMRRLGVRAARPIAMGKCDHPPFSYYVLDYIDGVDAVDGLRDYPLEAQYQIGVSAGRDLWRMHQLEAPSHVAPWYQRQMKKYKAYVEKYKQTGGKLRHEDRVLRFIDENAWCLKGRPNRFQHDDFHVGNIIVRGGECAGVIDFNRFDWGDPVHDFLKVGLFSSEISVPFCRGQLDSYFQGAAASTDFWRLYSVYLAMNVIASVVWTTRVAPDKMGEMMGRIERVLEDHKYFGSIKPSWVAD